MPQAIERAAQEAEARVTERLTAQHRFEKELLAREAETERRLKDQLIESLGAKIREQEERIREPSRKADEAVASVQGIALKALESAAARRVADARQDDATK